MFHDYILHKFKDDINIIFAPKKNKDGTLVPAKSAKQDKAKIRTFFEYMVSTLTSEDREFINGTIPSGDSEAFANWNERLTQIAARAEEMSMNKMDKMEVDVGFKRSKKPQAYVSGFYDRLSESKKFDEPGYTPPKRPSMSTAEDATLSKKQKI